MLLFSRIEIATMVLKFTNTLSGELEEFTPKNPLEVRMYVCGPTVYNYAHIGNARPAVIFDVLYRLLKEEYKSVLYARNYTDVDDKINAKASADGVSIELLTNKYIDAYRADTMALGVLAPDFEPRVTDNIVPIKQMIFQLVDQGFAYVVDGHVLFEVEKYRDYGNLAGRNVEDMIAGARIEVAPYKRNPADFVLWKPSRDNEPGWQADWGYGRPGWHIECSAMINDLFGDYVDIHGGGADLIFPHHENEIAQSTCYNHGRSFCAHWMHNGHLTVEGRKMSKSLGNGIDANSVLECGAGGRTGSWKIRGPDKVVNLRANKIGSECFRLWKACDAQVGDDFQINPEDIEQKYFGVLTKLFNVARFASQFPVPSNLENLTDNLQPEDEWILSEFQLVMTRVEQGWKEIDIYTAAQSLKNFATGVLPSHWLEMVKSRLYDGDEAAAWTLHRIVRDLLDAFAPICPFFSHYLSSTLYNRSAVEADTFPQLTLNFETEKWTELTESVMFFNSEVWKMKKDQGLSLNSEIVGLSIPSNLDSLQISLTRMHKLID